MIKAFLFDFDGTLADTAPGIVLTVQETFRQMHLPVPEAADVLPTIGMPLHDALQLLGSLSEEQAQEATDTYRRLFPIFEVNHVSIFPEVKDTLQRLHERGMRMAICTSRDGQSLDMILSHHGMADFFETRVTNTQHLTPKPAPDMVLYLLEQMHLQNDEALVVGDTTFDIQMGNSAGCATVAVTYGNHPLPRLLTASPSHVIDHFSQLLPLLG